MYPSASAVMCAEYVRTVLYRHRLGHTSVTMQSRSYTMSKVNREANYGGPSTFDKRSETGKAIKRLQTHHRSTPLLLDTLPSRISLVFRTQTQQESGYVRLGFPRPPLHVYNTIVWTPDHSGPGREEEKGLGFRLSCLVE